MLPFALRIDTGILGQARRQCQGRVGATLLDHGEGAIGITSGWSVDCRCGTAYTARRERVSSDPSIAGAKIILMDEPTQGTRQRTTPPETRSRAEELMSAAS
jgi:hypothetical protein